MRSVVLLLVVCGCSLVRSADDVIVGNGPAASVDSATEAAADSTLDSASVDSALPEEDRRWALWRMPSNTPTAYTTSGDVVTDTLTKLDWQRNAGPPSTYEQADAACRARTPGAWRLPFRVELISLLAISMGVRPAVNASAFPATPEAYFWTASTLATGGRYVVSFADATVDHKLGTESYPYRCVRSP